MARTKQKARKLHITSPEETQPRKVRKTRTKNRHSTKNRLQVTDGENTVPLEGDKSDHSYAEEGVQNEESEKPETEDTLKNAQARSRAESAHHKNKNAETEIEREASFDPLASEDDKEDAGIINKNLLNGLKLDTVKKKMLSRTAQKQWEELSPSSILELMKLLSLHSEPALNFFKSGKAKQHGRNVLNEVVQSVEDELNGMLVPAGFSSQRFNLDYLIKRAMYLQRTYSQNIDQVAGFERTLLKEKQAYKNNQEYLKKLEKNYREEERAFQAQDKKLIRPLRGTGLIATHGPGSLPGDWKFSNDMVPNSYDSINLEITHDKSGPDLEFGGDEDTKGASYDPGKDKALLEVLGQLDAKLSNIDSNIEVLRELNLTLESVHALQLL